MSTKYKKYEDVPTEALCKRLNELSDAVTKGREHINREFYMSVPAQMDNDADLVLSNAALRLMEYQTILDVLDKTCQLADDTCVEPGITITEAARRMIKDAEQQRGNNGKR